MKHTLVASIDGPRIIPDWADAIVTYEKFACSRCGKWMALPIVAISSHGGYGVAAIEYNFAQRKLHDFAADIYNHFNSVECCEDKPGSDDAGTN